MILSKLPRLNESQEKKLSDIASDLALVAVAVVALPAVIDRFELNRVILGSIVAVVLWILSLWLRR